MGFKIINVHFNVMSGVKENGVDTEMIYNFNLIEPPGYLINIILTTVLYQNHSKERRIEYIEFNIRDEHV